MKNPFWSHIIWKSKGLVFGILLSLLVSGVYGQDQVAKYFYDQDAKTPLTYLQLVSPTNGFLVYTDMKGMAILSDSVFKTQMSFNISGFGVNDTLISAFQLLDMDTVFLKMKNFDLPEVSINSTLLSELKIGDRRSPIREVKRPIGVTGPKNINYRYTIRVQLPKRSQLLLDQVNICVSQILEKEEQVVVRLLYPLSAKKLKYGINEQINDFVDLLPSPKLVTIKSAGWNPISFDEPIPIPKGTTDLFILFDLLETGSNSKFAIVEQAVTKDIDLGYYLTGGEIGVFHPHPIHPAIEFILLKE
jgi:hypothetical protein